MSCDPSSISDPADLTPEEQAIYAAYLTIPEVRDHYTRQIQGSPQARPRDTPLWLIALALDMSLQRIQQIEQSALRKLRKKLIQQHLTPKRKSTP